MVLTLTIKNIYVCIYTFVYNPLVISYQKKKLVKTTFTVQILPSYNQLEFVDLTDK